ncbi:14503_t:CDS:2, partial [Racocetra fulgida]
IFKEMEDDFEFVTNSNPHLTNPDSLGIYSINQVESYSDNTSVCPIPPGSPAYSSSMASSPREFSSTPVNGFQQDLPFEPYHDDPEEASATQLLYTSFDGPIDSDNGKCPINIEEDNEFHSNTHGHDKNHGHHHCGDNVNVRAAILHVLGDLLSSLGVLISSIVITLDPSQSWVDPLCTFIFSTFVMLSTVGIVRSSVRVLMEATPPHIDAHAVRADLEEIPGVKSVHDLHIWELTVGRLHPYEPEIQQEPLKPTEILAKARRMLKNNYGILQVTIQVE